MYTVEVEVTGLAPLLEHRYPLPDLDNPNPGGQIVTGAKDYSREWVDYFYADAAGNLYQPAAHFEGSMIKAAAGFRITGKRGKSYKDLFSGSVFVSPDQIPHGMTKPDKLDGDADKPLYLDLRPAVVQRSRVPRIRPAFKAGWKLAFEITCIDDQIPPTIVHDVLALAGRTVGIGDYRPKFGRFMISRFDVHQ